MSTITISRDFGSGGNALARKVAQTLGYHFVDPAFIDSVLEQYGLVQFDREYQALPSFWERFEPERDKRREVMADMLNQVERALAQHGNVVILGRSGFAILHEFSDVFRVRLQAPLSVRAARVMAQQHMTLEEATAALKSNDRARGAFGTEYYHVSWEAMQVFDLVINTGKVSPDLAASWLIDAATACIPNLAYDEPTTASVKVDPILAQTISDALKCHEAHR